MAQTFPDIRKIVVYLEETRTEAGVKVSGLHQKAVAAAIFKNPFAGVYQEDLSLLTEFGAYLGDVLGRRAVAAFDASEDEILEELDSYGKGVIVGTQGEYEHGHAIIHPSLGRPFREALGGVPACPAIMPSTVKVGGPGTSLDIPLHCKSDEWVVSRFDAVTICVPDGPREDEILVALAVGRNGRPLSRVPGKEKA